MTLKDIINRDLQTIAADLDNPVITWNGEDYECVPSSNGILASLEDGGFAIEADFIANVRKELFTDDIYPKSQQKLTYNNADYRIITVRHDASSAFVRLFCNSINRGV